MLAVLSLYTKSASAQTFTTLHAFTQNWLSDTNGDGSEPQCSLKLWNNILYGAAKFGGSSGNGTVFSLNLDGTSYTNLHRFTAGSFDLPIVNSDGAEPAAGLILSGNTLYGTTFTGGSSGYGTVFDINIDGSGFTNLYTFTGGSDGLFPQATLLLSGNTLYGTAGGGSSGFGTVFAINTDSSGFTNLYTFSGGSDGAFPQHAQLILSGNILFGTTIVGGNSGKGTVFAVNTSGAGFTNLYSFSGGSDGGNPATGLVLSGSNLYGTTSTGGSGSGTVFNLSMGL